MRLPRNRRLRPLPVRTIVPNILTVLALCAGLTSIRLALQDRWELAVVAIIVAGIFDGLDGRLARLLKATSKFGAELDSLSDIVAFGVAPGVVLYTWSLHEAGGLGWIVVLVFGVSCALRLARFNIAIEDPDRPAFMANFFTGVPAPGGAGLALLPMMISFQGFESVFRLPAVCGPFLVGVALLMISRLPTYSFKRLRVRRDYVLPVLMDQCGHHLPGLDPLQRERLPASATRDQAGGGQRRAASRRGIKRGRGRERGGLTARVAAAVIRRGRSPCRARRRAPGVPEIARLPLPPAPACKA
jgi:CDP-diacylglycerol--serine O-phosphatidyltransferase